MGPRPGSRRRALCAAALLAALGAPSCNGPVVVPLDDVVVKHVRESIASAGRTNVDVLWVVDDSSSMCEEQANLTGNFRAFVEGLAELEADIQMAVVTTDVADDLRKGRFQARPVREFTSCLAADPDAGVACSADGDCGDAGCLCGVPHLRRCAADSDCDVGAGQACVSSGRGSTVRFCSTACLGQSDCRSALTDAPTSTFFCGVPPEGGDRRCLLRVCADALDCAGADGHQCVPTGIPGDGAPGYCRLFAGGHMRCPAPTCDCPRDLAPTLRFAAGGRDEAELERAVRTFRCLATVGTEGDDIERGLAAIRLALSPDIIAADHPGFPRDDAHLVIVTLSDEDDCTGDEAFVSQTGLQCAERGIFECVWCKDALASVTSLADFVRALKRPPWQVAVAAIVGDAEGGDGVPFGTPPPLSCASANGAAFSADRYTAFVKEFGALGVVESICDDSYEAALQNVAGLVASLSDRYCLAAPVRRCATDAGCPPGSRCGRWWGDAGQCVVGGAYVGVPCSRDRDCPAGGRCDDRQVCKDRDGDPAEVEVWVERGQAGVAAPLPPSLWSVVPDAGNGCLRFDRAASPGPEDAVELRYISSVE